MRRGALENTAMGHGQQSNQAGSLGQQHSGNRSTVIALVQHLSTLKQRLYWPYVLSSSFGLRRERRSKDAVNDKECRLFPPSRV